jgi:hypothetical protein
MSFYILYIFFGADYRHLFIFSCNRQRERSQSDQRYDAGKEKKVYNIIINQIYTLWSRKQLARDSPQSKRGLTPLQAAI